MERASRFIGKLTSGAGPICVEDLARTAWPLAVGKRIAAHARATRMVRARLIVEVEDAVWRAQLFTLSSQILFSLEKHLGKGIVEDVEFRIVPRRIEPQLARQAQPSLPFDEADEIADPVLRGLYKTARKRAQA